MAVLAEESSARKVENRELLISAIRPSPLNPRKHFDDGSLKELAESIKAHGILEPIVVRYSDDTGYEIVCGERRWRAAKLAGLSYVPVRVLEKIDDRKALELALVENLQRQDIDPIEEAEGYKQMQEMGYKQAEVAAKVNRSPEAVSNAVRLLKLPDNVRKAISEGRLTVSHGKALLSSIDCPALFDAQVERALEGSSTKELEEIRPALSVLAARNKAVYMYTSLSEACNGCNNRRKDYCLDPACNAAKREEARQKAVEELKAKTGSSGDDKRVIDIEDLHYGQYEDLGMFCASGCRKDCEHRVPAINHKNEMTEVCLDPNCHRALRAKQTKEENKSRRAKLREFRDNALAQMDTLDLSDELAALVAHSIIAGTKKDCLRDAIAHLGLSVTDKDIASSYGGISDAQCWEILTALGTRTLIRLAAECKLRDEINDCIVYANSNHPRINWLLKKAKELRAQAKPVKAGPEITPGRDCNACMTDPDDCPQLPADGSPCPMFTAAASGYEDGETPEPGPEDPCEGECALCEDPCEEVAGPVDGEDSDKCIHRCSICPRDCEGAYPDNYPAGMPDSPKWLEEGAVAKWVCPHTQTVSKVRIDRIIDQNHLWVTLLNLPEDCMQSGQVKPEELWPWEDGLESGESETTSPSPTFTVYTRETSDQRPEFIYVSQGIGNADDPWLIVYRSLSGGEHRIKSIPLSDTKEAAQKLLDEYAKKKRWAVAMRYNLDGSKRPLTWEEARRR